MRSEKQVPTAKMRVYVLSRDKYQCAYCGASAPDATLHVDHIVNTGAATPDNLQTLCAQCNMGKGSQGEGLFVPPGYQQSKPKPEGWKERIRVNVRPRADLYRQARFVVHRMMGEGGKPDSLSQLIDDALERELKRLANKHNDGEPWPEFEGTVPGGRRPKGDA